MKKYRFPVSIVAALFIAVFFLAALPQIAQSRTQRRITPSSTPANVDRNMDLAVDIPTTQAQMGPCSTGGGPCCQPCNYFENFDGGGFVPGFINGQGAGGDFYTWVATCSTNPAHGPPSTTEGHVDTINPFGGAGQHLRLSQDPTRSDSSLFACVLDARVPANVPAQTNTPPIGPTTVSMEIAISALGGANFNVQPQARWQGFTTSRVLFYYSGSIYIQDEPVGGGGVTFVPAGVWDTTGGYQHLDIVIDPCTPVRCRGGANDGAPCQCDAACDSGDCAEQIHYDYGNGAVTYDGVIFGGVNVDQFLVHSDNSQTAHLDIDNVRIERGPPCQGTCGNGIIELGENCEFAQSPVDACNQGDDSVCPGQCVELGDTGPGGEPPCTCVFPNANACDAYPIENDVEFVQTAHGGWFTFTAGAPAYAVESCGSGPYDSRLSIWSSPTNDCSDLVLVVQNDDCNDIPVDGDNSDPLASCFNGPGGVSAPFNACTCVATTLNQQYWIWDDRLANDPPGNTIELLVSKRLNCGAIWGDLGACCRGLLNTCEDNVAPANCTTSWDTFALRKVCASQTCEQPAIGACCLPNGNCTETTFSSCLAVGGWTADACQPDNNGDGLSDGCVGDCDGDGILDIDEASYLQKDCDADGTCNGVEIAGCQPPDPSCADCNNNDIPDGCEPDCNHNDVADGCDVSNSTSDDCNGNDIPDECELDCNNNGVPDSCDIQSGTSEDCNVNAKPDDCEFGGCCLDLNQAGVYERCTDALKMSCVGLSGVFRGPCGRCPVQNFVVFPEPGGGVFIHRVGPPIDCLAVTLLRRGNCQPTDPKIDVWKSEASADMCHNFGATGQSIPADFFDPGSDMVTSSVCLEGLSLGIPEFGEADTLISRDADPFDRCSLAPGGPSTVNVEIMALSLVSTAPLTVTYDGGATSDQWDVAVDLSSVTPPAGSLTATKTHCNGGTYTSVLNVQPRFTFRKVGNPSEVRILDTGLQIPPFPFVTLDQDDPMPWVHDLDPGLGLTGDPCTSFYPGVEDAVLSTACNCNGNTIRDTCEIEANTEQDCNENGRPDSCDVLEAVSDDCDTNGQPDECQPDCNVNDVIDPCDIIAGTSEDENANVLPDECERGALPPSADSVKKSRYLSYRPGGSTGGGVAPVVQALRVKLPSLPGWYKWITAPDANGISGLDCAPVYRDWGFGKLHVTGRDILPNKTYVVQGIALGGNTNDEVHYSKPPTSVLTIEKFGDLVPAFGGPSQPNFADIEACVDAFIGRPNAPPVPVADIAPETPNKGVNFVDIEALVKSFRNFPYPYGGPVQCQ